MTGVLIGLLGVLALLAVAVIAVLVTPVKFEFAFHTRPRRRVIVAARLFAGLTPRIQIHDSGRPARKKKPPRKTGKKREGTKFGRRIAAKLPRMIATAPQLLTGLLRPIRIEEAAVDADIGLFDPADTGYLYGLLSAITYSMPPSDKVSIGVRPDFSGPRFSGEARAVVSCRPAAFVPPVAQFAWHVFGPRS